MTHEDLSPARFGDAFKAFMEAVAQATSSPDGAVAGRIRAFLGVDVTTLPVTSEEIDPFEQPNVQVALDAWLASPGREAELIGVAAQQRHYMQFGLATITGQEKIPGIPPVVEGPVDYVNFHLDSGRVLPCVQFGLYLVRNGDARFAVAVVGPSEQQGPRPRLRVEVITTRTDDADAFLADLRGEMLWLNVYRGHVISLSPGSLGMGPQTLVAFHAIPEVTREDVILPEPLLARVERQTFGFAEHTDQLLAAGRSLKRGMLLYGLPGTGKTLTLMYLIGRMPGRTVLLATGLGMGLFQAVAQMARTLALSMIVLEDVDLIAEERGRPFGGGPLLFELLNEMDGLRDDTDVIFALTTNRPEVLEPALGARPGRVDLAVELPLPGAPDRCRLLEHYARGLELADVDMDRVVSRTEGASPAYIKELLRRAALLAMTAGSGDVVTGQNPDAALDELADGGPLMQRALGFHVHDDPARATERSPGWRGFEPR